ncbi:MULTISPECIES: TadE/TadG family type IV pilus assembly protein [Sphingobium]|uniref:TadE/TadG family type IV pilus assembly protein n=1 Tax=Sphingobium sp. MI1205 TaxID=407020 RepID=UPI00077055C3|nr:Tad domain-containing protein [Sphingobium sp. MI1205]AMK17770.1 Flp pilus assembly protein TadG [Sphingobium sp. MI1205]
MGDRIKRTLFILMRLYHNQAGNTLAIVAAAIFPLAALIGGGVDISRIYLTKTRLQQACDAGALAGRRAMTGLTWTTGTGSTQETADRFFTVNFPANKYGTNSGAVIYSASETGAVTGNASVVVPMTLMSLFHMPDKTVTATCTADLQLPNTDVMFVLDTTLSMNDINLGDSQSRIAVLRGAVSSFYTELENVRPAGSRIRYGFVPYSSTVNVGMLLKRDWIMDIATYDSRVYENEKELKDGGTQGSTISGNDGWKYLSGSKNTGTKYQGPSEECIAPPNKDWTDKTTYESWDPSSSAVPRTRKRTRVRNGTTYSKSLNNGICWITPTIYDNYTETLTEWVKENPNAGQENPDSWVYYWRYKPVDYSMADLKGAGDGNSLVSGGSFTAPVGNFSGGNPTSRTITWNQTNGCIEERATRRSDEGAGVPRYDMDVDLVPDKNNVSTQWKPFLPGLVYGRNATSFTATTNWVWSESASTKSSSNLPTPSSSTSEYGACPTYARKLAEIDSSTLSTYLAALKPAGFTYHDIGMLWGLRLMSREGLFAAEHAAAESSGRYARHLIFMTDGDTDTRIGAYDAWGMSAVARRRTPTGSIPTDEGQDDITEARLAELCNIAKNQKNITVWVIAFGTTLTTLLSDCASPGRAYQADNSDQLTATFSQIASQIAQLRVTR